jgi:hypothetical protein
MTFELDHLFICTAVGAPEANSVSGFGLTEGERNIHPGQGTANRRFFFRNGMLELLWLSDEREARGTQIMPTRLYERCKYRETGASPFGLCLRPSDQTGGECPFEYWEYRPPYLSAKMSLYVASNSHMIAEPLLFYVPVRMRPDEYPEDRRQPLEHKAGFEEITSIRVSITKTGAYSTALRKVDKAGWLSVISGEEHLMNIGFDGEKQGKQFDFRPELPLIFNW